MCKYVRRDQSTRDVQRARRRDVDRVFDVVAAMNEPHQDDFKIVRLSLTDDARVQSRVTVHEWIVPEGR
jgi:hypothetical protein